MQHDYQHSAFQEEMSSFIALNRLVVQKLKGAVKRRIRDSKLEGAEEMKILHQLIQLHEEQLRIVSRAI